MPFVTTIPGSEPLLSSVSSRHAHGVLAHVQSKPSDTRNRISRKENKSFSAIMTFYDKLDFFPLRARH